MNNYTLCTGYFHKPDDSVWAGYFFDLWIRQNLKQITPERVIILANGGAIVPAHDAKVPVELVSLANNLGHVHSLLGKCLPAKPHAFAGWSGAVMATAMLAYSNETDYLWLEQDALIFGDCIERAYEEMGTHQMIFGKSKTMPCAQSLFIIRHAFIPEFVHFYLGMQNDRSIYNLPEHKFSRLLAEMPHKVCQFGFGVDRERPIPMRTANCFYCQKLTPGELKSLSIAGFLDIDQTKVPDVKVFSNDAEGL